MNERKMNITVLKEIVKFHFWPARNETLQTWAFHLRHVCEPSCNNSRTMNGVLINCRDITNKRSVANSLIIYREDNVSSKKQGFSSSQDNSRKWCKCARRIPLPLHFLVSGPICARCFGKGKVDFMFQFSNNGIGNLALPPISLGSRI
jgi:hypothetical protein